MSRKIRMNAVAVTSFFGFYVLNNIINIQAVRKASLALLAH